TNSSWPSGVRLRLLGVLPDGAAGYRAQWIVSSALPSLATSSTLTFVELAHATKSRLPSGDKAISVGWPSGGQVPLTLPPSRSMTATADLPHRLTKSRLLSVEGRQVYG